MRIPGTAIEVDDFRPEGASLYVLTHYHADHRRGLRRGDARPILCSAITARLLRALHRVPESSITVLDPGQRLVTEDGVQVRAFDANHCPGAIMLRFDVGGRRILHTGDFRYAPFHDEQPELFDGIDLLLLDRTFAAGERTYEIPPQDQAIEQAIELIRGHPDKTAVIGVYLVGKNRLVRAIAQRLRTRVALPRRYHRVWSLLGMEDCITTDTGSTRIHGKPMGYLIREYQKRHPRFHRHSIVILPTGWPDGFGQGPGWYYVPYSEHCSSAELDAFVARVAPREIVATNEFF